MSSLPATSDGAQALHSRDVKTLSGAWRHFLRRESPRLIGPAILALLALRIALGDWGWRDAAAAGALIAIYPFGEWAIHVYLLHLRPFRYRGKRVELRTARAHRAHHEAPNDLNMVLLEALEVALLLLVAVPFTVGLVALAIAALGGGLPAGPIVSAWLAGALMVGIYEWTHFLIHTAHRPRSVLYRRIWTNHRLHHFKNEHYWHGITNTLADRVLGTYPDHTDVAKSHTARTLDSGPA